MLSAECPHENIVLVGFMGSGKTSIGKRVAKQLGFQFIDTDQVIVDRAGLPISDIFARDGEPAFRDLETSAIISIGHLKRCVIATGGGAVLRDKNRTLLRGLGFVIELTADEDTIYDRVARNTKRPLLQTEDPRATLRELLQTRRPFYDQAAQFVLDTTHLDHAAAADAIIAEARRAFSWHRSE